MSNIASGIYKITNSHNGKFYVGSSVNIEKRFCMHRNQLSRNCHRNSRLQRSWNKHGEDAFQLSVLEIVPDKRDLIAVEQRWIDELDAVLLGYNICKIANSRLGVKASMETRVRQSISATGFRHTDEAKTRMSVSKKGKKKPARSQEHRDNLSKARKMRPPISEETRLKLSIARKKRPPISEETREKMRNSMLKTLSEKRNSLIKVM